MRCPWLQAETKVATILGNFGSACDQRSKLRWAPIVPSGVHALPLAAGINEGGHYFRYIFLLGVVTAVIKTPEGVVIGFQIFAWAPK